MPELPLTRYRMPSYRSGDGTYGVSRSNVQTMALDPVRSPRASASRMALRLLPRNPLATNTIPSAATGDGIDGQHREAMDVTRLNGASRRVRGRAGDADGN